MTDTRKVIYAHTVKALLSRVFERRKLLTPEVRAELARMGIDPQRPRDLEVASWWQLVGLAARLLSPGTSQGESYFVVGSEMLRGFEDTMLGKTVFLVFRTLGNRRAMQQLAETYKTADTVTQVESRVVSENAVEVTFRVDGGVPHPEYTRGILLTGLELVGARSPRVKYATQADGAVAYLTSWA